MWDLPFRRRRTHNATAAVAVAAARTAGQGECAQKVQDTKLAATSRCCWRLRHRAPPLKSAAACHRQPQRTGWTRRVVGGAAVAVILVAPAAGQCRAAASLFATSCGWAARAPKPRAAQTGRRAALPAVQQVAGAHLTADVGVVASCERVQRLCVLLRGFALQLAVLQVAGASERARAPPTQEPLAMFAKRYAQSCLMQKGLDLPSLRL